MIYTQELTGQVALYVTKLYDGFQTPDLQYHNLQHTHRVIKYVNEIASNYQLDEKASFILITAAWFHDCGHLFGPVAGHEEKSNLIMRGYFEKTGIEKNVVDLIEQAILSTRFPYQPSSLPDEILCDADSYHLGTEEFLVTDDLVKKEFELRNKFVPANWDENTLHILEQHCFFTAYCQSRLRTGKQKNIEIVRKRINHNA